MNSLNNTYLTLDSNGLGEIREVRLYSGNNTLFGTLRKASDSITGNNEFFEYICRYFGLRQEYSQDLLLNSIISDLSGYTIEDLEVFEKYAVPVSSSEETSLYTKYFGTVNINERSITPLLVPSGVKTLKIVDTSDNAVKWVKYEVTYQDPQFFIENIQGYLIAADGYGYSVCFRPVVSAA